MRIFAFDSGTGGLTAVAPILKALPGCEVVYLGDLANLPYGSKSPDRVRQLTQGNISWMLANLGREEKPAMVVLACNTASAHSLPEVEKIAAQYGIPAFGVIDSGCKAAIKDSPSRVVVIATSTTVASHTYTQKLRHFGFGGEIIEKACPLFVPLVEEGLTSGPATEWIIRNYLDGILQPGETVVLGCTHYPYLLQTLSKIYPQTQWIDAGGALVKDLQFQQLVKGFKSSGQKSKLSLYFTDHSITRERVDAFTQGLGLMSDAFTLTRIDPII